MGVLCTALSCDEQPIACACPPTPSAVLQGSNHAISAMKVSRAGMGAQLVEACQNCQ